MYLREQPNESVDPETAYRGNCSQRGAMVGVGLCVGMCVG